MPGHANLTDPTSHIRGRAAPHFVRDRTVSVAAL